MPPPKTIFIRKIRVKSSSQTRKKEREPKKHPKKMNHPNPTPPPFNHEKTHPHLKPKTKMATSNKCPAECSRAFNLRFPSSTWHRTGHGTRSFQGSQWWGDLSPLKVSPRGPLHLGSQNKHLTRLDPSMVYGEGYLP